MGNNKLTINNNVLKKEVNKFVDKVVDRYISAGKKAAEDIRTSTVDKWYGSGNHSMSTATMYDARVRNTGSKKIITITSHVNIGILEAMGAYPDARRWSERHAQDYSMPWSPSEYVVFNQWELGIYALPARARFTGTGWVNKNFIQKVPLRLEMESAFKEQWAMKVQQYVKR